MHELRAFVVPSPPLNSSLFLLEISQWREGEENKVDSCEINRLMTYHNPWRNSGHHSNGLYHSDLFHSGLLLLCCLYCGSDHIHHLPLDVLVVPCKHPGWVYVDVLWWSSPHADVSHQVPLHSHALWPTEMKVLPNLPSPSAGIASSILTCTNCLN